MTDKKSGFKCTISSCLRGYRNATEESPVRLFKFPTNKEDRNLWASVCKLQNIDMATARICDIHFEKKCFGSKKLKLGAVPTLKLFQCQGNDRNATLNNLEIGNGTLQPISKIDAHCDEEVGSLAFATQSNVNATSAPPLLVPINNQRKENVVCVASVEVGKMLYLKDRNKNKILNDVNHSPPSECNNDIFTLDESNLIRRLEKQKTILCRNKDLNTICKKLTIASYNLKNDPAKDQKIIDNNLICKFESDIIEDASEYDDSSVASDDSQSTVYEFQDLSDSKNYSINIKPKYDKFSKDFNKTPDVEKNTYHARSTTFALHDHSQANSFSYSCQNCVKKDQSEMFYKNMNQEIAKKLQIEKRKVNLLEKRVNLLQSILNSRHRVPLRFSIKLKKRRKT